MRCEAKAKAFFITSVMYYTNCEVFPIWSTYVFIIRCQNQSVLLHYNMLIWTFPTLHAFAFPFPFPFPTHNYFIHLNLHTLCDFNNY